MPQFEPTVLTDRASPTPLEHTFNPRDIQAGVATLAESGAVPLGDKRITLSQVRSNSGRIRVTVKVAVPVVQDSVVDGITKPVVVRTNYADLTFNYDAASSQRERDDIVGFIEGVVKWEDNEMFGKYLVDLEGMF